MLERAKKVHVGDLSKSSVHRLLKTHGASTRPVRGPAMERRSFIYEHASDLWVGDSLHGPLAILPDGSIRKTYCRRSTMPRATSFTATSRTPRVRHTRSTALRDKHLGRLEELLAKGNAAQRVLDEAEEQRFQLSRALRRFKTDANAVRAAVHGSLVAIGPWGSRNRFWADRYFRKYTKKQLKTVVDEGEATEVDDESESDES